MSDELMTKLNNSNEIPEIVFLLSLVQKKYGRRIATTTDFESLSVVIEHETGEILSSSTLKRLWGYVSSHPTPRKETLDILCRYIGYRDFKTFCEDLLTNDTFSSNFLTVEAVYCSDLKPDAEVLIGWNPNRLVKLKYLGDSIFEVVSSQNSKLLEGDRFERPYFISGHPLFLPRILRSGEYTPAYIAGNDGGLTILKVL